MYINRAQFQSCVCSPIGLFTKYSSIIIARLYFELCECNAAGGSADVEMFSNFIIMSPHLPLTSPIMIRDSINQKCHPLQNNFGKYSPRSHHLQPPSVDFVCTLRSLLFFFTQSVCYFPNFRLKHLNTLILNISSGRSE